MLNSIDHVCAASLKKFFCMLHNHCKKSVLFLVMALCHLFAPSINLFSLKQPVTWSGACLMSTIIATQHTLYLGPSCVTICHTLYNFISDEKVQRDVWNEIVIKTAIKFCVGALKELGSKSCGLLQNCYLVSAMMIISWNDLRANIAWQPIGSVAMNCPSAIQQCLSQPL